MKRTRLHTGEFRWSDDFKSGNEGYLEQRVFVVRHLDTDPEGVGTHYEFFDPENLKQKSVAFLLNLDILNDLKYDKLHRQKSSPSLDQELASP